jgi:RNA polymerase sigma factor (sigma-70 family)
MLSVAYVTLPTRGRLDFKKAVHRLDRKDHLALFNNSIPERCLPYCYAHLAILERQTMKGLTDSEWIRQLKNDDPQAIEGLWVFLHTQAHNLVKTWPWIYGLSEQEAEDLASEAVIHAYLRIRTRGVNQFRGDGSFRGFCRMTLVNRAKSLLPKLPPPSSELDNEAIGRPDVQSLVSLELVQDQWRLCLERLSPREREVLWLQYDQSQSFQAIADHLGITRTNAGVIAHRARRELRDCLEEQGFKTWSDFL